MLLSCILCDATKTHQNFVLKTSAPKARRHASLKPVICQFSPVLRAKSPISYKLISAYPHKLKAVLLQRRLGKQQQSFGFLGQQGTQREDKQCLGKLSNLFYACGTRLETKFPGMFFVLFVMFCFIVVLSKKLNQRRAKSPQSFPLRTQLRVCTERTARSARQIQT